MIFKKKYKRILYDVALNDADYPVQRWKTIGYTDEGKQMKQLIWKCPYYTKWKDLLSRCYSEKVKKKYPSYQNCTVCGEWLTFSNFKAWMEQQDWEGMHLDKDILVEGNTLYSPETCCFVPPHINTFLTDRQTLRGMYPIGVGVTPEGKYRARISYMAHEKFLGIFDTVEEAHLAWLNEKIKIAKELASSLPDKKVANALVYKYEKILW